jgi:hypothetical protein
MSKVNLPLRLIVETAHVRAFKDGKEILLPQRVEVQNDAACLYQLLDSVDTAEEKYKTQRRRIRKVRKLLRPVVRQAEQNATPDFDGVVGEIEISDDALKFVVDLFDAPPEGVQLRGAAVDTAEDLRDLHDEIKRQAEPTE